MTRNRRGFTLVELLVVVLILGVVAAIAIPRFSRARERAYFATLRSDLKSLQISQEIYYHKHFDYTADFDALGYRTSSRVTVVEISLAAGPEGAQGWWATATHETLGSERGCVIYDGAVAGPITQVGATADTPGRPFCADTEAAAG